MLKDDLFLDQDLIKQMSQNIASNRVDEEISRHPELITQKERLHKIKQLEAEEEINKAVLTVISDLQMAGEFLNSWFERLPPAKRDQLIKEFKRAGEIFLSDWFIDNLKKSIDDPLEKSNPLQKVLKLSDETLQAIYTEGKELQKKSEFTTARAIFRFLSFLNPLVPEFWICLGFCLSNLQNYDEAKFSLQLAITLDSENPQGHYFLALNYVMQKDYDAAFNICQSCLQQELEEKWVTLINTLKTHIESKKVGGNL